MTKADSMETEIDEKLKKIADLLYGVLFFNIFTMEELYAIVREERLIKWLKYETSKKIYDEGVFDQHFYIVIQGKVALRKQNGKAQDTTIATIQKGEVFGEGVVCAPDKPRATSAYVESSGPAVICVIDATLVNTVPEPVKAKFMKKFLDLVISRFSRCETLFQYYNEIIHYARKAGIATSDEFFSYAIDTAVNDRNRLTLFIKYTDFLIAKKIPFNDGCRILEPLLLQSKQEFDESMGTT